MWMNPARDLPADAEVVIGVFAVFEVVDRCKRDGETWWRENADDEWVLTLPPDMWTHWPRTSRTT